MPRDAVSRTANVEPPFGINGLTKSLLKLREEKGVNESVGEFVIVENSKMMELSLSKCHEVLKTMPHISGKDKSKILQPFNELNSCYRQLSNVNKQRQALKKNRIN